MERAAPSVGCPAGGHTVRDDLLQTSVWKFSVELCLTGVSQLDIEIQRLRLTDIFAVFAIVRAHSALLRMPLVGAIGVSLRGLTSDPPAIPTSTDLAAARRYTRGTPLRDTR
jgi:hypothetical protein